MSLLRLGNATLRGNLLFLTVLPPGEDLMGEGVACRYGVLRFAFGFVYSVRRNAIGAICVGVCLETPDCDMLALG